jgi:cytochrome c peroxidase
MRGSKDQLGPAEKNGFNLFMGKAKCGTCHFAPLFNGLVPPEFVETESEVLGVPKSKDTLNAQLDDDPGKFNFTQSSVHKHAFKTPTLRNIELTAPYMHNGVFSTLEEVMTFYNNGGGRGLGIGPPNQTLPVEKLKLSPREIRDIIAFMRSLTDPNSKKK